MSSSGVHWTYIHNYTCMRHLISIIWVITRYWKWDSILTLKIIRSRNFFIEKNATSVKLFRNLLLLKNSSSAKGQHAQSFETIPLISGTHEGIWGHQSGYHLQNWLRRDSRITYFFRHILPVNWINCFIIFLSLISFRR